MTHEEYEKAAAFWTEREKTAKTMDAAAIKADAAGFLRAHKICALATGGGADLRCTPLEYTWHDDALWIFSEGGLKFRGLEENKHVALTVFETQTTFGKLHGLQMFGTAEVMDDVNHSAYIREAEIRKIPIEALQKLKSPMHLIKIVPDEITVLNSDFKQKGFESRQTVKY